MVALLFWAAGCSRASVDDCPGSLKPGLAESTDFRVVEAVSVDGIGRASGGRVARCAGQAAALYGAVGSALKHLSAELRPAPFRVALDPRTTPVHAAVDPGSRTLFVSPLRSTELSLDAWLHEFGHLSLSLPTPQGPLARGVVRALGEALADYYAGVVLGRPGIAAYTPHGGERRDLSQPPSLGTHDWSALGLPGVTFDEHRVGHALAGRLWAGGDRPARLRALLQCRETRSAGTPGEQLAIWVAACPEALRAPLGAALRRWLPAEFH